MRQEYEKLFSETFLRHYDRGNITVDPRALAARAAPDLEATYGSYMRHLSPGSRVLDLGCGTGYLLHWISQKGLTAYGVDQSSSMIEAARYFLPDLEITLSDGLEYLQAHPTSFSAIFCHDVLEHLPTEDSCLAWVQAARRALLPGGFFICRVPNAANLTACHMRYIDFTHRRSFTSFSLIQLLETAGLSDCRIIPLRRKNLIRRFHLLALTIFHRAFYLFCGNRLERHFHKFIIGIGFNRMNGSKGHATY
jgi:2-polyprenyl-3-methyl-5-hydroxy-6-metoxy-1,4-benzoquinol methylase